MSERRKRIRERLVGILSMVSAALGFGRPKVDRRDIMAADASRETMRILGRISSNPDTVDYARERTETLQRLSREQDVILRRESEKD